MCAVILFSAACSTKDLSNAERIRIHAAETGQDFSEFIDNIEVLRLNTDSCNMIGEVSQLVIKNKYIYILDAFKTKKVYVFDRSTGNITSTISRHGNANHEYVSIMDIQIDDRTGDILIMDASKRKIKRYDKFGNFISELGFPCHANKFFLLDSNSFLIDKGNCITDGSGQSLALIDATSGEIITQYNPVPEYYKTLTISPYVTLVDNDRGVSYLPSMSNTIYSIQDGGFKPRFYLDFGNRWPDENTLKDFGQIQNPLAMIETMAKNGYVMFPNFLESAKWLHVNFEQERKLKGYFYNKEERAGTLVQLDKIGRPLFLTHDDKFVFVKSSDDNEELTLSFVSLRTQAVK